MSYCRNILETIGRTPLVRLNRVAEGLAPLVLAKLEYFNPGGSVKDRMAVHAAEEAERKGLLKPGGTIVESTSGNTGIALAIFAAVKGHRLCVTLPDKTSEEKVSLLRALGAEVVLCPSSAPPDSPESYYAVAERIARETPDSFQLNQYTNQDNVEAHYATTGPEIWSQTGGRIDYLVAGIGTGGTLSGSGRFLKEQKPDVTVIGVDPVGSIYHDWYRHRKKTGSKPYLIEGIGKDIICETMHFEVLDDMIQVTDRDAFAMARQLAREEGIFVGGSSGAAAHAALELAGRLGLDDVVVVILPDSGYNYLSRIFQDDWMRERGILEEEP